MSTPRTHIPLVRPRVIVSLTASIDGKIGPVPSRGQAAVVMPRSNEDRDRLLRLRGTVDAILIGANSVRADDPGLGIAPSDRALRRAAGTLEPYRIVLTHLGQAISPHAKVFDSESGGPTIVVHPSIMPTADRQILAERARLVEMGKSAVDFAQLLTWLRSDLDVRTLLCEGGGIVCAELIAMHAIDELHLTVQPRIVGGRDAPTLVAGSGFDPDDLPNPQLLLVEHAGGELFLRYQLSSSAGAAPSLG